MCAKAAMVFIVYGFIVTATLWKHILKTNNKHRLRFVALIAVVVLWARGRARPLAAGGGGGAF